MRAMPRYFVRAHALIRSPARTNVSGALFSRPRIQSTMAQTHNATISISHIRVVLEVMNTGVKSAAKAARKG